ncbi:MAG: hypothetical protein IIB33_05750, partial [Chloroflexi bacterium]|nr:hypothetical protein [Chloroflexota bacterium]
MPDEGANETPSSERTDVTGDIEADGADGKAADGAVEAGVASQDGESGNGHRGEASDPADASEEEILNVRVRAHGGGGGGGGFVVEDMEGGTVSMGGRGGGRRSARATRDLTEGSVPKNLWVLAWPQMVEGILNVVDQMADLFWAGRFVGARAIAGLGVAQDYTRLIMTGRMGLDMGMQAMVARAIGADRVELANHVALQAFTLTITFTLLVVTTGAFFTDFLLQVLGV